MFAILLSWGVISFVLYSFGDMILALYNKICGGNEDGNLPDKLILGLCFIVIPLQMWSLWLPSNHIFLLLSVLVSAVYCIFVRRRVTKGIKHLQKIISEISAMQLWVMVVFFLLIMSSGLWVEGAWDSIFYHYQNIRWIEEYSVVPGLGNLDDRYGFNSNYMLLSAVFSFRYFFGEGLYTLHILFILILGLWVIWQLFSTGDKWQSLVLLVAFALFFFFSLRSLFDTSTDLLPNMIIFYLVAKFAVYPPVAKQDVLLYTLPLVLLVTCKLSLFFVCFFGIYILISLMKGKNYKAISFILVAAVLILVPWMIRNVILSGYLVYPVYQVDLFAFDWKIPREVAILQNTYIYDIGQHFLKAVFAPDDSHFSYPLWQRMLIMAIYILAALSLLLSIFYIIRTKVKDKAFLCFFLALFLALCVWFMKAPDARFVLGILCGMIVLGGSSIKQHIFSAKFFRIAAYSYLVFFLIAFLAWDGFRMRDRTYAVANASHKEEITPISRIIFMPYRYKDFIKARDIDVDGFMSPYALSGNIVIKVSSFPIFDEFPAVIESGIGGGQFLDYRCLEARGKTLQDGFRTKVGCGYVGQAEK